MNHIRFRIGTGFTSLRQLVRLLLDIPRPISNWVCKTTMRRRRATPTCLEHCRDRQRSGMSEEKKNHK